jgi:hypothetical protein
MAGFQLFKTAIENFKDDEQKLQQLAEKIAIDSSLELKEKKELGNILNGLIEKKENELDLGELSYNIESYELDNNNGKPSASELIGGTPYPIWVQDVFFKDFVWLPDREIQATMATLLTFQNSMVVPNATVLPHWYFLSNKEGSGKSITAKWIGNHYPEPLFLYLPEDISFGGLRNSMDSVCKHGYPCLTLLDNFNPESTIKRIGAGYSRLLKNTREESRTYIGSSEGKGNIDFNCHSSKIFTSIFKLGSTGSSGSELRSRCLHLKFEPSEGRLNKNINAYDWSICKQLYHNIWSDPQKSNNVFKKSVMNLESFKSPPLNDRQWQLSIVPIAVGVHIGLFENIDEGIDFLCNYWDWWRLQVVGGSQPTAQLLEEYWEKNIPTLLRKEVRLRGEDNPRLAASFYIPISEIKDFIKQSGLSTVGLNLDATIIDFAKSRQWKSKIIRGKIILAPEDIDQEIKRLSL